MNAHNVATIGMIVFLGAGFALFIYGIVVQKPMDYAILDMILLFIGSFFFRLYERTKRVTFTDWTKDDREALK